MPALDDATAKFVAMSNVLGGIRAFDRGGMFGKSAHKKAAAHVLGSTTTTPKALPKDGRRLLRISWQTELAAQVIEELDDDMLRRVASQTLPVQAYYAVFSAARATTMASGTPCETHQAVHREFATQRAKSCFGGWGVTLSGDPEDPKTCVLDPAIATPSSFNLMEQGHADEDYVWAALRMTRRWKIALARDDWLKKNKKPDGSKRKNLPGKDRAGIVAGLRPTTMMDFLYEMRRRTNYEGVEEYGSDADDHVVQTFHGGLLHLADMGLLHYEAFLAERIGYAAYEVEIDAWAASAGKVGSWATKRVETRARAIKAALSVP